MKSRFKRTYTVCNPAHPGISNVPMGFTVVRWRQDVVGGIAALMGLPVLGGLVAPLPPRVDPGITSAVMGTVARPGRFAVGNIAVLMGPVLLGGHVAARHPRVNLGFSNVAMGTVAEPGRFAVGRIAVQMEQLVVGDSVGGHLRGQG